MIPLPADEVAWAAQLACLLEVNAWKPGNVSRIHDFADCRFEDFLVSVVAIGPAFREAARSPVGKTILEAVRATRGLVGTNTNLGMAIALAPLAKAAGTGHPYGLRAAVVEVLQGLTVEDARMAYEAIRVASPAGLGNVQRCDVYDGDADVTLRAAMELARDRDALASEYVTGFELTFDVGYATLLIHWEAGRRLSDSHSPDVSYDSCPNARFADRSQKRAGGCRTRFRAGTERSEGWRGFLRKRSRGTEEARP